MNQFDFFPEIMDKYEEMEYRDRESEEDNSEIEHIGDNPES